MDAAVELVRMIAGGSLAALGLVFVLGSLLGLLRFPDFYTRVHAVRVSDSVGAVLICIGLAVLAQDGAVTLRLVLLAVLVSALGPVLAQLAANAAHAGGLAPLTGRYVAPRPGQTRDESAGMA